MAKPVILVVDDEPQVLNAVERDVRRKYGKLYRVVKAASGPEALDLVTQLKRRGAEIALFLVDQRMPEMTGTEFLLQARQFYPEARKVLLTAYADTTAAIHSINQVGLNYYLLKPWDPPEENLYPVLTDQLEDWIATARPPYEGIRVVGTLWSPTSHEIKDFLARNNIPYQYLDIERDPEGARLAAAYLDADVPRLPVVLFPDETALVQPAPRDLADRLGLQTQATQPFYDMVIIGGGPAGLAASVYAASEGYRVVLIEKEATGGQAGTSARIENYLGFPNGLSGADLSRRATTQARRLGAEILTTQEVTGLRLDGQTRITCLGDNTTLSSRTILISTGVAVRKPTIAGLDALTGAGVYYGAAFTEAANYRGEDVFILGGANSAGQGAVFLASYARTVTLLVRASSLVNSMSRYLIEQIHQTPNIRILYNVDPVEVRGHGRLEGLTVKHQENGATESFSTPALFIFIGAVPRTDFVEGVLQRDRAGFILTGPDLARDGERPKGWPLDRDPYLLETSVPGIFAAGDVRHGSVKRVASAVGEGSIVVQLAHQYLRTV